MDFEQCPYRFYLKVITRAEQPEIPDDHPMVRGRRIHEEVERYISQQTEDFPSSGRKHTETIEYCRGRHFKGQATVEEKWGFTQDWVPVGWWEDGVWCRMATDYHERFDSSTERIIDWKTGKSFGNEVKYMQQMQLYAVGAFMRNLELTDLEVSLYFLDDGKVRTKHFERGDKINKLTARFTERAMNIINTVDFRPKPSMMNCKYCPFGVNGTKVCVYAAEGL
jgi:RecB family exonuclease